MTRRNQNSEEEMDAILEAQIGDTGAINQPADVLPETSPEVEEPIEQIEPMPKEPEQLKFYGHQWDNIASDLDKNADAAGMTKLGGNIRDNAAARDGWMAVDRALLGDRSKFYPETWQFLIKPATVEAIRNWSTINDNSANSIDDVFNEVLKSCLAIKTPMGPQPWYNINNWDRFFFILLIREYTFINGDVKIEYTEDCINCEAPVKFTLNSQALMYDLPEADVYKYFDEMTRTWSIIPSEFDVETDIEQVNLYLPTIEKDMNIKQWLISKIQENRNYKVDQVFIRFLPWLCPKISKDLNIAKTQIRNAEQMFKSWDIEMFSFMDEVLRNISVTPGMNLLAKCPSCGEEVTSPIRFQDGISALFSVNTKLRRTKKFGSK